jgi:hypothetical protein
MSRKYSVIGRHLILVVLATLAILSWLNANPTLATNDSIYPLAMCSNNAALTNPTYPPMMIDAGARMCRIDVSFPTVRRNPDPDPAHWNWGQLERIRALKKQFPNLDWLPIIGYGATWALDPAIKGATFISSPQAGINVTPVNDPKNLYGHFVYEAVSRYKDCVHYWESWNEPDLPGHHYFHGDGHDFFPYQKTCYLAAKMADPTCKVLFGGVCYPNIEGYLKVHNLKPPTFLPAKSSFFEEYLQECVKDPDAKNNNYYFDIMSQHSYSRASDMADYTDVDRKLMRDYLGEEKPVWITEMGMVDHGGMFGGTADEYCDYILQSYVWGCSSGVQRFFHFQLDNSNQHGLYIIDKPKPALTTYRDVLANVLANTRYVEQMHGNHGVGFLQGNSPFQPTWKTGYNLFKFAGLDGKHTIYVAFSDTDRSVDIEIPAKKDHATLIDRHNNRTEIKPVNGVYKVHLLGATNVAGFPSSKEPWAVALGEPEHLVGGATEIVLE